MNIYKVNVLYTHLTAKEAGTVHVLASSVLQAEERARDAMEIVIRHTPHSKESLGYKVDRKLTWVAVTRSGLLVGEG